MHSTSGDGRRVSLRRVDALVVVAALATLTASCGDAVKEAEAPRPVVEGVLLDGTEPVAGVELELMVWPGPQGGASAAPELLQVDTDVTDEQGRFELGALGTQLSPHATSDGLVGIDLRRVGEETFLARTTVQISKAPDTGVIEVEAAEGLELNLSPPEEDEVLGEGAG